MKTNMITVLAVLAVSALAGSALAQVKGGERLLQSSTSSSSATVAPGDTKPMSCAKCEDVLTTVPDSAAKDGSRLISQGVPTKAVVSHLCGSCNTTTVKVGLDKQAKEVDTHTCAISEPEQMGCCNTTPDNGVATNSIVK
jgi:hypothetical protein